MSIVTNPLLSTTATGTIAKAITFRTHWGKTIAQKYPTYPETVTPAQRTARDHWGKVLTFWQFSNHEQRFRDAWQTWNKRHEQLPSWNLAWNRHAGHYPPGNRFAIPVKAITITFDGTNVNYTIQTADFQTPLTNPPNQYARVDLWTPDFSQQNFTTSIVYNGRLRGYLAWPPAFPFYLTVSAPPAYQRLCGYAYFSAPQL